MEQIRSAELMVKTALSDPAILTAMRQDPEATLKLLERQTLQQMPRALEQDKIIYRIVVAALGLTVLIVVVGAVVITLNPSTKAIPDVLTALASAAIGALAGLLAPSPVARR